MTPACPERYIMCGNGSQRRFDLQFDLEFTANMVQLNMKCNYLWMRGGKEGEKGRGVEGGEEVKRGLGEEGRGHTRAY